MRIGIVGAAGRMGRMLTQEVLTTPGCTLAGGVETTDSPFLGEDVAVLAGEPAEGLALGTDTAALFARADAVIDFTLPAATAHHATLAAQHGTALVVGTTGLQASEQQAVETAARTVSVVQAPNMSLGVNLLFALVEKVAATLGPDYDIEVLEMHHRHKRDAPSGTALGLGRAAAAGRGVDLNTVSDRVRDGVTGARTEGNIGFATLRGGDVVGDHTVIFAAEGERVELGHKAGSRHIFARGAVHAAQWCGGRAPGLYSMRDVLGV